LIRKEKGKITPCSRGLGIPKKVGILDKRFSSEDKSFMDALGRRGVYKE